MPAQTTKIWLEDLKFTVSLQPTSITIYDCLYSRAHRNIKMHQLPTMAFYGELYNMAYAYLIENNYHATYGSENFSKFPQENGTSSYFSGRILKGTPYLGFGNYATSQIDNDWWFNTYNVSRYINNIIENKKYIEDYYQLPDTELMAKFILSNLNYGVINKKYFKQKFKQDFNCEFDKILNYLVEQKLMHETPDEWQLSFEQFASINLIKSLFYTKGMKDWMIKRIND